MNHLFPCIFRGNMSEDFVDGKDATHEDARNIYLEEDIDDQDAGFVEFGMCVVNVHVSR